MLLAIDVGNTNITCGIFQNKKLLSHGRISTLGPRTVDEYTITLRGLLENLNTSMKAIGQRAMVRPPLAEAIEAVILSSVVPKATVSLRQALKGLGLPRPLVLGENVKAPIVNRYRIPRQVGQDRLVNAVAACELYGAPAIVADFGTAVTIDLVSRKREYLGGLIVPGIEIALEALTERAALLPKIELVPPKEFLGRDTASSMRSGIFFGYSKLCDGIIRRMKAEYAPKSKVIATGGYAGLIAPFCQSFDRVNPHLTLQGLELIYRKVRRPAGRGEKTS